MRPLRPADRKLVTVANDDQEVEVATFIRLARSVGAEQPGLFRLKLGRESHGEGYLHLSHYLAEPFSRGAVKIGSSAPLEQRL